MDSLDNHPIPQDVTHFQFRLIGDMTIKQFGYLAAGLGLAWFIFAVPFFILIKVLFVPAFAFLGILLAFIPIEGRPADLMLTKFMKALFTPNQYIFKKSSGDPIISSLLQQNIPTHMATVAHTPTIPTPQSTPVIPIKQNIFVSAASSPIKSPLPQTQIVATPPVMQPPVVTPTVIKPVLPQPIVPPPPPTLQAVPATPPTDSQQTKTLEAQLTQTQTQKQKLEQELMELRQQLANQQQTPKLTSVAPPPPLPPAQETTAHVKKIPPPLNKAAGAPMMALDVPNIVMGIVKDSRGNVIPNILIEVKDQENNPVRAFKTNQLGQFASATPLMNGVYTVFFEDPGGKHTFDTIELTTDGTILLPLEIVSIDQREELRKELFG